MVIGQWARKIRQQLDYLRPSPDADTAAAKYLQDCQHLQAGRKPPQGANGCRPRDRLIVA